MSRSIAPRGGPLALGLGLALSLVLAVPVMAWQATGGTRNCGQFIGFTHARYNDSAAIAGPGGPVYYFTPLDGVYHTQEVNGSYSGDWSALGDPLLDYSGTYAGCRNYGAPQP